MRTTLPRILIAALTAACSAGTALAAGAADSIVVQDPYVRLAPPGAPTTAAFMVLKNTGDKDVTLVKADNPASKTTELHGHINDGGVMRMRPVAAVDIKAKGEAALKPGGLHLMMIDLKAPLKDGDKVTITLGFGDGSSKQVEAPVRSPTAEPVAVEHADHAEHMDHKH
jgi:copper(I)-binding protein